MTCVFYFSFCLCYQYTWRAMIETKTAVKKIGGETRKERKKKKNFFNIVLTSNKQCSVELIDTVYKQIQ